ncbi:acyl-CoA thioesterase [Oceanicella actignis]|uniref:acyl-CoA thioesterase n=1 Tax=Oceanicella actignis TaxID=1189325 RepID=UPI0011E669A8|nr:acyl-CoA thioesterase [Oceanicella actignis]TYO85393.1 thioesterase superfamily protein [Oceanicella actignis]
MYPFFRVFMAVARARRQGPLRPGQVHSVRTRCWPWDIDPFMELNNGRSLTLMDIGRISMFARLGLRRLLAERGLRLTMAGARVQYRARVLPFAPIEIRSRVLGLDARFILVEHLTLTRGRPAHHALYRVAVVGPQGLVPAPAALADHSDEAWRAPAPDWAVGWSAAENAIPWPPELADRTD